VRNEGEITAVRRPDAPDELTEEQAVEWYAVVNRMPADWFPRETHGMLVQHCRLIVRARRLAQLANNCESSKSFDAREYRDLVRMEKDLAAAISSLATRMRISQHSQYSKDKKVPGVGANFWDAPTGQENEGPGGDSLD
jgi:hypothetical protein